LKKNFFENLGFFEAIFQPCVDLQYIFWHPRKEADYTMHPLGIKITRSTLLQHFAPEFCEEL